MATLRVRQIAKDKGLTLAKLAEMLNVHPVNLSSALNGNPTLSTLSKIAEVLEVEVADLFEKENKTSIYGFVKVGSEVLEITTIGDLEQAIAKAKVLK